MVRQELQGQGFLLIVPVHVGGHLLDEAPAPGAFPPEAGQAAHQQLLQLVLLPHRVHNHPQAPLGLHAAQAGGDQVNQRALEQAGVLGGLGQGMHLLDVYKRQAHAASKAASEFS